jgi:nicotinamidase-related amidase
MTLCACTISSSVKVRWGAAIVDELTPTAGDIVLIRTRMSVFNGTEIDVMLRNLGVDDLIVVGAWTNMAVEHTIRDAADEHRDERRHRRSRHRPRQVTM